jgi:Isochorismatase family
VISTLVEAHDLDYRLFVLADATADPDAELHPSLIGGFFPKRAEMIEVADLDGLLA